MVLPTSSHTARKEPKANEVSADTPPVELVNGAKTSFVHALLEQQKQNSPEKPPWQGPPCTGRTSHSRGSRGASKCNIAGRCWTDFFSAEEECKKACKDEENCISCSAGVQKFTCEVCHSNNDHDVFLKFCDVDENTVVKKFCSESCSRNGLTGSLEGLAAGLSKLVVNQDFCTLSQDDGGQKLFCGPPT